MVQQLKDGLSLHVARNGDPKASVRIVCRTHLPSTAILALLFDIVLAFFSVIFQSYELTAAQLHETSRKPFQA